MANVINDKITNLEISFKASFTEEKYSMDKIECFVKKINSEFEYVADIDIKTTGEARYKLFCAYISEKGKELAKDYIESGKPFVTVPGTESIMIQIIAYSKKGGTVTAKKGRLVPVGPYKKREAVIAAVADAYRGKRTFERNLNNALEIIDKISAHKPDLIALSEAFYGRQVPLPLKERAITLDSEPVKKLCEKAKKYKTYICFSIHAINKDGNIQNIAVMVGRDGNIVGTYAKTHLTMGEYESGMEPGDKPGIFETDFGKVGVCICWDLFFPEFVRQYHLMDADIIVNPTAGFNAARTEERAKDNGVYILVSGTKRHEHSRIVDPEGRKLDVADSERKYAVAKVDLNKKNYVWYLSSSSYSTRKNVFKNERVPELYK